MVKTTQRSVLELDLSRMKRETWNQATNKNERTTESTIQQRQHSGQNDSNSQESFQYNSVPIQQRQHSEPNDSNSQDTIFTKVSTVKFHSVTLDENLTFNVHVKNVTSKISKSVGVMRRLHCQLPADDGISYTILWCIPI